MSNFTNNHDPRTVTATQPNPPPSYSSPGVLINDHNEVDKTNPPMNYHRGVCSSIKKGTIKTVKSTHPVFGGKSFRVEGTLQEVMGIDDPWMSNKALGNPAVANYLMSQNPPAPYHGTVYYGKIEYLGYCIHESYL
jgi:hypothetical protein